MTREHMKSSGRNQSKGQQGTNTNRKQNRQQVNRKKSEDIRTRPHQAKSAAIVPAKESREIDRHEEALAQGGTSVPHTPNSKPVYQRELNIKIPANIRKKNPSIDLPDLKAVRR